MYLIGTKQPGQFLSSWGFWGKELACREHRTCCFQTALPLGKGPSLPHPRGPLGLSEWVCNLGRPIRLSYPSGTVIGPEEHVIQAGPQPSPD